MPDKTRKLGDKCSSIESTDIAKDQQVSEEKNITARVREYRSSKD